MAKNAALGSSRWNKPRSDIEPTATKAKRRSVRLLVTQIAALAACAHERCVHSSTQAQMRQVVQLCELARSHMGFHR